ncbi:hypothetical protein A2V68_00920 [candidate division Kazan bacterium RBG_13_50_9]|uniref:Putative 3-methyladenine DNA glycosylase n=1 Tax=candidate division Kazan bacterium RBG_13_50_9 TaxID=1798535 RepID=A0A1F4NSG1_UNCK3|nr:MAG: hypothetical protein A2V68_00920 [candidate division Kazan bacterium RBG_13_50_9]
MRRILRSDFFRRPTPQVARELLGKVLVRRLPPGLPAHYRIVETEAYCGTKDLACHASRGRTRRTETMFGPAGRIYVYMIYGMHHCLNLVTAGQGEGEAVLIRAVEPLSANELNHQNTSGPGKLCRALRITKQLNGMKLGRVAGLWVEDRGLSIKPKNIGVSARRGVAYAGKCAKYPWRFFIKSSDFVS